VKGGALLFVEDGDGTEPLVYTFELRKGMRWSDGHSFTTTDILYWWTLEESHPDMPKERDAHRRVIPLVNSSRLYGI